MWRLIRGCGLSYGYAIRMSPNEGRLIFSLYRATNAVAAYSKAKSILVRTFKNYITVSLKYFCIRLDLDSRVIWLSVLT